MTQTDGNVEKHPSSYRDPSGYIFSYKGKIYRQVNQSFKNNFELFLSSGLYQELIREKLIVSHEGIDQNFTGDEAWFTTLKPQQIPFISYPYEWSFDMLKDAALLTLRLAVKALEHGMILKDASPYNVQFHQGQMMFIDTLSFEKYNEGEPWIAYRQFCESFVAPLALMHDRSLPLQQLLVAYPEGIPLQYAKSLLSFKSRFNVHLYLHVHLHSSYSVKGFSNTTKTTLSKQKLNNLLNGLQTLVSSFSFDKFENVWGKYYEEAETRPNYLEEKKTVIGEWLSLMPKPITVLDAGGNQGEFSKLAAGYATQVICADGEHFAINRLYKQVKRNGLTNLLPLCIDFTNPTPAIGVNNEERQSFFARINADLVMGLALIHHLSIGRNIPFELVAKMFAQLGRLLIIEFVDKKDEKVKLLLQQKKDIYTWYTQAEFERVFSLHFKLIQKRTLSSSPRTLYLMERL